MTRDELVPGPAGGGPGLTWHPDYVRLADCCCCGRPTWAPRMCRCGHRRTSHEINTRRERTACFRMDAAGPCDCKRYDEVTTHG